MPGILRMFLGGAAAGVGFALGVSGTLAGAQRLRPLAKQAMKSYLVGIERAREMAAELGETLEDLYAEAVAEREAEARAASSGESPPAQ